MKAINESGQTVVLMDSAEAASIKTVTGWVSASGRFFGDDERLARYDGATHRTCEKNQDHPIYEKNGYCPECWKENRAAMFSAMPKKQWEGEPLALFDSDSYFFSLDELNDYCSDNDCRISDLDLVICEPNRAIEIDPNEYYCDDLSEDGEVPDELAAAFDALNAEIAKSAPLSWSPGKYAAVINEKEPRHD